ncbi:MAG: single-stranded DNA-binding protein [Bdellovibrionia bacterium]
MSVNKVILVGRLGQTPEVRYTPSGAAVGNFSIATNENWMDKSGQKQERTEWHKIVVWGKTAENCSQFLAKGRQVYVEGRLQTRQWQDKDNQTKYTTEVVAQTVQFLGGNQGASAGGPNAGGDRYPQGNIPQNMDDNGMNGGPPMGGGYNGGSSNASAGGAPSQQSYAQPHSSGNMEPSFTEDDIPF